MSIFFVFAVFPPLLSLEAVRFLIVEASQSFFIGLTAIILFLILILGRRTSQVLRRYQNTSRLNAPPWTFIDSAALFVFSAALLVLLFKGDSLPESSPQFKSFLIGNAGLTFFWLLFCYYWFDMGEQRLPKVTTSSFTDEPIFYQEQDLLGRNEFVNDLYKQIVEFRESDSFVFGLYGGWGEGKSSVIQLLKSKFSKNNDFILVDFNPWKFKNEDAILKAFYFEIDNAINETFINPGLGRMLSKYREVISFGIAKAGFKMDFSPTEETLSEVKTRIEENLARLGKRILITVDDIDRLQPKEMLLVLKLVRLNSNFRRSIFLLALDPVVVLKYLRRNLRIDPEYLEKIIQKPVPLPAFDPSSMDAFFNEHIGKLFDKINVSQEARKKFEDDFSYPYIRYIRRLFKTLRHAKRFLNSLRTSLPAISSEINLHDFLVMEIISVFWTEIHTDIWQNRWYYITPKWSRTDAPILSPLEYSTNDDERYPKIKDHIEKALKNHKDSEILKELLLEIFPEVSNAFNVGRTEHDGKSYRAGQRIAHPDCFRKYFMLKVLQSEISDEFVETTLMLWNTSEKSKRQEIIEQTILDMKKEDKLIEFFEKLDIFQDKIQNGTALSLVKAILIFSDKLRLEQGGSFLPQSEFDGAIRFLMILLDNKVAANELGQAVEEVIENTPNLAFASTLVVFCNNTRGGQYFNIYENVDHSILRSKLTARLKKHFLEENKNVFDEYPNTWDRILYGWVTDWEAYKNENKATVNDYVFSIIGSSAKKYSTFLMVHKGRQTFRDSVNFDLDSLAKNYDLSKIKELALKYQDDNGLTDEEKETLKIFIQQYSEKFERGAA